MENLVTVATQVAILFALVGAGFVCRMTKLLNDSSVTGLINILLIIVTPCLVIDVFQRPFDPAKMQALSRFTRVFRERGAWTAGFLRIALAMAVL